MSTPLIWIGIPLLAGVILGILPKTWRFTSLVTSGLCLALVFLAWVFPTSLTFILMGRRFEFASQLVLLGRTIQITQAHLTMIGLLYLGCFLWNTLSSRFEISSWFHPLSLIITALWVFALSIEPFLYAAVLIEIILLLTIPLISPRGEAVQPGLLRYLTLQTIAMPLILLSGWMLTGISSAPSANPYIIRAALLVFLGFFIWLAIFPFNSWATTLSEESHPWVFGFVMAIRQAALIFFLLFFLDRYAWLRELPRLDQLFRWIGVISIAAGGISSAFQAKPRRQFAYLFLFEIGYAMLALSLRSQAGYEYLAMQLFIDLFLYWLAAFSLSQILKAGYKLGFDGLRGIFYQRPFLSLMYLAVLASFAGLPLFAHFPVRRMIWNTFPTENISHLPLLILGQLGLVIYFMRVLVAFVHNPDREYSGTTGFPWSERVFFFLMSALVVFIGTAPQWILPFFTGILHPFTNLLP